jgi:hypothetical protein
MAVDYRLTCKSTGAAGQLDEQLRDHLPGLVIPNSAEIRQQHAVCRSSKAPPGQVETTRAGEQSW